jgi:hypothetical protein
MTQQLEYEVIETEIMKLLTKSPDVYVSQFTIYDKLLDHFKINDPVSKTLLKDRLLVILRVLTKYDNVLINKNDGVYYVCFQLDKDHDDICFISDKDTVKSTRFNEIKSSIEDTDISVIRFIVDQDLKQHFNILDTDKNNILHLLIKYNDILRVEKFIENNVSFLMDQNVFEKTPFDLINSTEMSGLIIKKLYDDIRDNANEIYIMKDNHNKIMTNIDGIIVSIQLLSFIVMVISLYNMAF